MASLLLLAPLLSPLIVEGAFVAAPDERTVWERATGAPAAASATAATGPSDSSSRRAVPAHVQHLPPADPSSSSSTSSSISGFLYYDKAVHGEATSVSHDGRSVRINNQSTILLSGSVHYMRLTPGMWAEIFAEARAGGLNAIETYCFWTDHEQVRNGGFDFSGRKNLSGFVRAAGEAGLWVLLRPGPYVGAEYSGGGFPHWLRDIPGLKYRNYNQPWIDESTRWMSQLNVTLRDDLVGNGGNIIMAQIENEWNPGSNCMQHTGPVQIVGPTRMRTACSSTCGTGNWCSRCNGTSPGCGIPACRRRPCSKVAPQG